MSQSEIYFLVAMTREQMGKYQSLWRAAKQSGDHLLSRSFARIYWRCRQTNQSLSHLI